MRAMGVEIEQQDTTVRVQGRGLRGLQEPREMLDCGNSGTTLRLLTGLLAGQDFFSITDRRRSLRSRPMGRVVEPLRALGARIEGRQNGGRAPLAIRGSRLQAGEYELPVASAQVKSALLLAALTAEGQLRLTGKIASRDHSERMLAAMGIDIRVTRTR